MKVFEMKVVILLLILFMAPRAEEGRKKHATRPVRPLMKKI
jgi:hypothetical protein